MKLDIQKLRQEAHCCDTDGITGFYADEPEGQEGDMDWFDNREEAEAALAEARTA
jgi:hypothetical protein